MTAIPREVRMNLAWMSPYSSSEALSIMSLCSSVRFSSVRDACFAVRWGPAESKL